MTERETPLTLGISPCPNDTFIFHALLEGLIDDADFSLQTRLEDVQTLNVLTMEGALDIAKVSFGVLPYVIDRYALLRSGGAMGYGCGPLVVARPGATIEDIVQGSIAIPGRQTTANLLWRLFAPAAPEGVQMTYDRIMPAVEAGQIDAGLIIHESRFTYADHGLAEVIDLGKWWEETTGSPIPLGAIVGRRSLGPMLPKIEGAIRRSVEYAFQNPGASADFVAAHAQEMSPEVRQSHIDLYVNDFSVEMRADGERAIRTLFQRGTDAGIVSAPEGDLFSPASAI